MAEIILTIPDDVLSALGESPDAAADELRMLAAVKLFELKKVSSGKAARLAGIPRVEFLQRLADYGLPFFDLTEEDYFGETRLA